MASQPPFKQEPHKLLVIPGPIEVADDVLYANAHPSMSHMSPEFTAVFAECLQMTRDVLLTTTGQPLLISGSGTLGWDQVAANLVEAGERALVLASGYFGDGFADCLRTYGAEVDIVRAPLGAPVPLDALETALASAKYKVVTLTHVDTSTGVLSDPRAVTEVVRRVSPETLVVVDAVCSVASEEIRFDEWDLDVVLSASQKGIGAPPGLSVLVASQRALGVFHERKTPPASYYASWKRWLPIMDSYEARAPKYFATPPVNLLYALHAALTTITRGSPSLAERLQLHRDASARVKDAIASLGLSQVPTDNAHAANGMTAVYFPEAVTAADVVPKLSQREIIVAGGLHADIKDKYFRIGHMGVSVVDQTRGDLDKVVSAVSDVIEAAKATAKS